MLATVVAVAPVQAQPERPAAPARPVAPAFQPVEVASLDHSPQGVPWLLQAHWWPADGEAMPGPRPAVVLLHGCAGAFDRQGRVGVRERDVATLLHAEGWHVLLLDSFSARGVRELCTQPVRQRSLTVAHRRDDALGALRWLAAQPGVDARRLALLGWSNGGSTALRANQRLLPWPDGLPAPRAVVALYPGCAAERRPAYHPLAPMLMLLGAADDWTPAAECLALAEAATEPRPLTQVFDGAHHGFDGTGPVRHRPDVPNGQQPGAGVHVGGQPEARAGAHQALRAFLRRELDGR